MKRRPRVPASRRQPRTVRALVIVADPDAAGLIPPERLALQLRREATITGRCACGAVAPPVRIRQGKVTHWPVEHEHDCPAASAAVDRLAARLGDRVLYQTLVVDLEVAA